MISLFRIPQYICSANAFCGRQASFCYMLIILAMTGFFNANFYEMEREKHMDNTSWQWGQDVGLTDGTRPDSSATRQEVMALLHRLYALCTDSNDAVDDGSQTPLPFTDDELDILYRIAWAEARGEDDKGVILVINVIMNRMNSPVFRNQNTIREVVFAPNQFEPTRNGAFERATPDQRIKDLVHMVLRGTDFSRGALFFNAVRLRETSWVGQNRTHAFDHGGHSFYF